MINENNLVLKYKKFDSLEEMPKELQTLYIKSTEATKNAYAPYSNFKVGAAVLLEDGEIVLGSNQENAAYPSGLCAERTALFYIGANKNQKIKAIAVAATKDNLDHFIEDISPCGGCRQVMNEYENKQGGKIQFVTPATNGTFIVLDSVKTFLPFEFTADVLDL